MLRQPPQLANQLQARLDLLVGVVDGIAGQVTVPTGPPDEPPPTPTALMSEDFDAGGLDGQALSTLNTSARLIVGAGSVTLSGDKVATGSLSARVDGITQDYGLWGPYDPVTSFDRALYWFHDRAGSDDAWMWGALDGSRSTWAFQWGIDEDGKLIGRNASAGTVTRSTGVFVEGARHRIVVTAVAGGAVIISAHTGITEQSLLTTDAVATITFTTTAAAFTDPAGGLLAALAGGTGTPTGNLMNEDFESGTVGAPPTNVTTSYDVISGAAALTFGSNAETGTKSLHGNGSATAQARKSLASHTKHLDNFGYRHTSGPTSGNFYPWELRAGTTATVAAQIGIQSDFKVRIRDSNSGTAVVSPTALTAGVYYDFVAQLDPSQAGTARFQLDVYLRSSGVLQFTLNSVLTATNFSWLIHGINATPTGTVVFDIDDIHVDNSVVPYGTTAFGPQGWWDHDCSDSAVMPAALPLTTTNPDQPNWAPTTGAFVFATTGTPGAQGSSSLPGMDSYTSTTGGKRPHGVHVYLKGPGWSGEPTANELKMFRPAGGTPAMPVWTWKLDPTKTWAQIAGGSNDTDLRRAARGMAKYGNWQWLGFYHEMDNDSTFRNNTAGYSAADYRNMWRHCWGVMKTTWADDNVLNPKVIWYVNYAGHSNLAGSGGSNFLALYPGDDIIDVITHNPYWDTTSRTGLDLPMGLLNENWNGTSNWQGFEDWATTQQTDFSGAKLLGTMEFGPNLNALSDSQAATRFDQLRTGLANHPRYVCMCLWDSTVSGGIDSQLAGHATPIAAYKAFVDLAYMTQSVA